MNSNVTIVVLAQGSVVNHLTKRGGLLAYFLLIAVVLYEKFHHTAIAKEPQGLNLKGLFD